MQLICSVDFFLYHLIFTMVGISKDVSKMSCSGGRSTTIKGTELTGCSTGKQSLCLVLVDFIVSSPIVLCFVFTSFLNFRIFSRFSRRKSFQTKLSEVGTGMMYSKT